MPEKKCVFPQCGEARYSVGAAILKLRSQKADVTWKKEIIQIIKKYNVVDKNLRERLELGNAFICELHYKKCDIAFTSKL